MDEGGGWVPGLDLLPEDGYDAVGVFSEKCLAERGLVDCFEHLGREGAHIVEVWDLTVSLMEALGWVGKLQSSSRG